MSTHKAVSFALASTGLLLLAACSTVQSRKQERLGAFQMLTAEQQRLVSHRQIQQGMDTNAVYVALGAPSMVITNVASGGPTTTWVYQGNRTELVPQWAYLPNDRGTWTLQYQPLHYSRSYTRAEVVFQNGHVVEWQGFPGRSRP